MLELTKFQHTATRRWLLKVKNKDRLEVDVSTHSHPKVAALSSIRLAILCFGFNTQPPEGGCRR